MLCLVKVKKKNTAKTVYEQSCSRWDPKRSWSVKIDKIKNVAVKKTFAGTDQTTWNRVKLRYFDSPISVFIGFIEISRIYAVEKWPYKPFVLCFLFDRIIWYRSFRIPIMTKYQLLRILGNNFSSALAKNPSNLSWRGLFKATLTPLTIYNDYRLHWLGGTKSSRENS